MSEAREPKIILDLSYRADVPEIKADNFNNFIQQEAFHRLRAILHAQLDDIKKSSQGGVGNYSGLMHDRCHNAVAILGGRGSGKTTFILNALEMLAAKIESPQQGGLSAEAMSHDFGRVHRLDVIDPTLIEHKEHILITVLSKIKEVVDARYRQHQRDECDSKWDRAYERVIEDLKKVGAGLPILKEIGSRGLDDEAWDNPQYVLQSGLDRARSGAGLERTIRDFIGSALDFIGKDAFVLPLDDIDTNFESGWPVLEVLRKYITTPRLIVLLSGDFALYSLLVRDRQWKLLKQLNKIEGVADSRRHHQFRLDVDRLESQYLQKVIKPGNRIELMPLSYFWEIEPRRNDFWLDFQNERLSLEEVMQHLTRWTLYSTKPADQNRLAMLMLRQPVRTVIHVLRAMENAGLLSNREQTSPEPEKLRELHAVLAETFLTELQSQGLIAERINLAPTEYVLNEVLSFLNRNDLWKEGYNLDPAFQDDAPSLASLCLAARLTRELRTAPALIFDYLVKVCLARDFLIDCSKEIRERTFRTLALDRLEPSRNTAARAVAFIRSANKVFDKRPSLQGTIGVYYNRSIRSGRVRAHYNIGDDKSHDAIIASSDYMRDYFDILMELNPKQRVSEAQEIGYYVNTWARLESQLKGNEGTGATFLRMVTVLLADEVRQKSTFVSALPLIGCLASVLGSQSAKEALQGIWTTTRSEILTAQGKYGDEEDEAEADDQEDEENEVEPIAFAEAVEAWRRPAQMKISSVEPLPVFVMARIWSRFSDALRKIDDIHSTKKYVGWLLHRQIVAFLNAFLVEEALHREQSAVVNQRGEKIGPDLGDPVATDRAFLRNASLVEQGILNAPIFLAIFACPLWTPYLKPQSDHDQVFSRHIRMWQDLVGSDANALESTIKIQYTTRVIRTMTHEFPNMHYLLNSLLVYSGQKLARHRPRRGGTSGGAEKASSDGGTDGGADGVILAATV
ncbi:MAG: hypothetical protein ACM31D_15450 [Bacteroidota bacterium]